MQSVDAAHAAAIAAAQRAPAASVFADWAGTGNVAQAHGYLHQDATSIEIDRSYATALPEGVGFIDGHAAAELRVELAGPSAKAVNRFNTASALYSMARLTAPITASLGMTGHTPVPQFTGKVRTISSDSRSGTARLEALDYAEKFRFAATVPDVIGVQATGAPTYTNEKKIWLNASWIIGEILSQGGVHISPAPLASCKLYASLLGSLAPRPGYGSVLNTPLLPYGGTPPFIAGRSGLALYDTPTLSSGNRIVWNVDSLDNADGGRTQMEFWALTPYTGGTGTYIAEVSGVASSTTTSYARATINATTGQMSVVLRRIGQVESTAVLGPTPTGAATWRYYAFHVAWSTTSATVTIRTGAAETSGTVTVGAVAGTTTLLVAKLGNDVHPAVGSLQVSNNSTADFSHSTHVPPATLDPSLLWLDRTPTGLSGTAWELLTEIAAAEYATLELSESGMLLYRNADRWAVPGTAVASITASQDMLDLAAVEDVDTVRNQISVPISNVPRQRKGDRNGNLLLRAPSTTTLVAAGDTATVAFDVNTGFLNSTISTRLAEGWVVSDADWVTPSSPFWSSSSGGTGTANAGEWETERIEWEGQVIYLTVTNTTAGGLYLGTNSGMAMVLTPPAHYDATDAASVTTYGPRPYSTPESDWRQQGGGAQAIAARILADLKQPVTLLDRVPVVGDIRRQLGDRITVKDPTGLLVNQDHWIVGIHTKFSPGSLTQDLTLRPCTT